MRGEHQFTTELLSANESPGNGELVTQVPKGWTSLDYGKVLYGIGNVIVCTAQKFGNGLGGTRVRVTGARSLSSELPYLLKSNLGPPRARGGPRRRCTRPRPA